MGSRDSTITNLCLDGGAARLERLDATPFCSRNEADARGCPMVIHFRVVVLALIVWGFAPPSTMAQDKPKIFLGASSKTLGYSPLWVGTRKGFFEKQGLDVQLVLLRGMPMTVQALSAGSLHIGSGGAEPYIDASERGLDFIL